MPRTDLFLKVEVDHAATEPPERIAAEICRAVRKLYGVRSAELSTFHSREEDPSADA